MKPLSFDDRVQIKVLGRHTPPVDMTSEAKSRGGKYQRKFNVSAYDKYPWQTGCPEEKALFCFPCLIFQDKGTWAGTGFKCISKMERCRDHEISQDHVNSCVSLQLLGRVDIRSSLSDAYTKSIVDHNKRVEQNRDILHTILRCLIFCGRLELPLRGNDETEASLNRGVFLELVNLIAEYVPSLKENSQH